MPHFCTSADIGPSSSADNADTSDPPTVPTVVTQDFSILFLLCLKQKNRWDRVMANVLLL